MRRGALLLALVATPAAGASAPRPLDDFRHGLRRWAVEAEPGATVAARDGILAVDAADGISLWYRRPLQGRIAIAFDVLAVARGGAHDAVSDVNAFWMAQDPRAPHGSPLARPRDGRFASYDDLLTYYVGIGGNRNTTTRLRRYVGRPGERPLLTGNDRADAAALLVPNRWMHVRLLADGDRIAVERDGEALLTLRDAAPYRRGWFALRTTRSHLLFRNVTVEHLAGR